MAEVKSKADKGTEENHLANGQMYGRIIKCLMEKLVLGICTGLNNVGWDEQVYNRQHWRALVVTVMNFMFLHFKEYHSDKVTRISANSVI